MIDITKKYRTRDGREVRIYATDGGDLVEGQTIHGAVLNGNNWVFAIWNAETGKNYANSAAISKIDLIEVRPRHKRTVWLNVYEKSISNWDNKEHADARANRASFDRIACIKVELDFEEGDGL